MAGGIEFKTRGELQAMRAAGLVLARTLQAVQAAIAPGTTTADLDQLAAQSIADAGATSNFLGYHGYPATLCISVNDEVVHGIPGGRVLEPGDLISVDGGCIVDGWHADSAFTVHVGEPLEESGAAEVDLIAAAWGALWSGVAAARAGGRLGDVSSAIERSIAASGANDGRRYGSVSGYGGHGIGTAMHMDPFVPNAGKKGRGVKLAPGMALAIEPMVTLGGSATRELDDGWTVVTRDGSRSAHVEHSMAITSDGVSVLTAIDRGAEQLARFGVVPVNLDS